jgi:hypothetical protein
MHEGPHVVGRATITARPALLTNEVGAFVERARELCSFVERVSTYSLDQRLAQTRVELLEVYQAAVALPYVEPDEQGSPRVDVTHPEPWAGFDEFEHYWEVFDPYVDEPSLGGSLSDDLLDVYGDVQRGLVLWDQGWPRAAIWAWRFHFDIHWGDHAVDALRALHRACKPR